MYYGSKFEDCMQAQIVGVILIALWVSATTAPFFLILRVVAFKAFWFNFELKD